MGALDVFEQGVTSRTEVLRVMRSTTQETAGIAAPIVSLEIGALQILAGGVNIVKAIIDRSKARV